VHDAPVYCAPVFNGPVRNAPTYYGPMKNGIVENGATYNKDAYAAAAADHMGWYGGQLYNHRGRCPRYHILVAQPDVISSPEVRR
jgi:hypothetical protein